MLSLLAGGGSSLIVYAVIAFGLISGSFAEGYHIASDHFKAAQVAVADAVTKAVAAEAAKNQQASAALEEKLRAQQQQARVVTQTVDRIVSRPVYLNVCFDDDGVHAINSAIAGAPADAGGPDKPVPATPTAGGR